jgi:hypothetical protein
MTLVRPSIACTLLANGLLAGPERRGVNGGLTGERFPGGAGLLRPAMFDYEPASLRSYGLYATFPARPR